MTLATKNPAFPTPASTDLALEARIGLIAEFDMLTYSDATTLTDLSGNGNDATFNTAPTTSSEGTLFDGAKYGLVDLPEALGDDYTVMVVVKGSNAGYYIAGTHNANKGQGSSFRSHPANLQWISGNSANIAKLDAPISASVFQALVGKVYPIHPGGEGRVKQLNAGHLGYRNVVRPSTAAEKDARTKFAIGCYFTTSGADEYVPSLIFNSGTIAWVAIFNRATSEEQDALYRAYLNTQLTARGFTV